MRTKILFIVLALAFLIGTTYADDESMFIFSAKSDVMMILDTSGSMMLMCMGMGAIWITDGFGGRMSPMALIVTTME